jgi:prolyl oligopeptidase PreP (S9A serine peptidase family)
MAVAGTSGGSRSGTLAGSTFLKRPDLADAVRAFLAKYV